MEYQKTFTFDVKKIHNGYIIYYAGEEIYQELSSDVNIHIENELRIGMIKHVIDNFPKGTTQRLVVTVSVEGKVMANA